MAATQMKMTYSEDKLKELVLYIAQKSDRDPTYGGVKLNKLLFFCDFEAYERLGTPITGAPYNKQENGPVPTPIRSVIKKLEASQEAYEYLNPTEFESKHRRVFARRKADLSKFSPEEIDIVNSVLQRLAMKTGTEASELSHEFPGWKFAKFGTEIPYETVFLQDPEDIVLSDRERVWVTGVVDRIRRTSRPTAEQRA